MVTALRGLNAIAQTRGQTLAQMAISWVLRDHGPNCVGITTALIGASNPAQIVDCACAAQNLNFTPSELTEIDKFADDKRLNLWANSSEGV
jgi:L-glyceraldehyde 3-phosphate reductase